jgi:hypothetical protein
MWLRASYRFYLEIFVSDEEVKFIWFLSSALVSLLLVLSCLLKGFSMSSPVFLFYKDPFVLSKENIRPTAAVGDKNQPDTNK